MTRLILLVAAISCLTLPGCGQSGPLYLPGNPSEIRNAPPPADNANDEEDEDGKDES